jgi:hypothetical protein
MELRQFRKMFLILMGITLIDLIMSMSMFSSSTYQVQEALAAVDELEIGNPMVINMIHQAKLGVSPIRFGGAFGFLMLIVPFILYGFVYHPTKSLTYTMLPASWQEKFASAWVMCVIFVPFMLFAFSLLVAFVGDLMGAQVSYHALNWKPFFMAFYLPTIAVQSIMFWGAFWFKRQKIGKTILTVAIFVLGVIVLAYYFIPFRDIINSLAESKFAVQFSLYSSYALMVVLWALALIKYPRTQI